MSCDFQAAGIEPVADLDATDEDITVSEISNRSGAANALHGSDAKCHRVSPVDADLQNVIDAWDTLPAAIKAAILAIVASQERMQK